MTTSRTELILSGIADSFGSFLEESRKERAQKEEKQTKMSTNNNASFSNPVPSNSSTIASTPFVMFDGLFGQDDPSYFRLNDIQASLGFLLRKKDDPELHTAFLSTIENGKQVYFWLKETSKFSKGIIAVVAEDVIQKDYSHLLYSWNVMKSEGGLITEHKKRP